MRLGDWGLGAWFEAVISHDPDLLPQRGFIS